VKVAVVGTGYVGLVVGACLAETGNDVVCADVDAGKIKSLQANKLPIYEPGLEPIVVRNQREGRLTFTTDVGKAVERSEVVFIAVGTPPDEDGSADLQHVLAVATTIGKHMNASKLVVMKSTVPVGTAEKVRAQIARETKTPFHVCSNPEFLKEGAAVEDFMKPDRVVVGVDSPEAARVIEELYTPFVRTGNPLIVMDIPSAELTKYAANAGHADLFHESDRPAVRSRRRGCHARPARHRFGPAHRPGVPVSRSRLRRIVLSEGREGPDSHRIG